MLFTESTFIGIDPTAGQKPMAFAAIDRNLKLLAMDEGSIDEITAFVGGQQSAVVGITSPQKVNQGLMKKDEIRDNLKPVPRPGRWMGFRVAEYQLRQHKIHIMRTCSEEEKCPKWMQTGFDLYRRLKSMGYSNYPAEDGDSQLIEVYPHAVFTTLLGRPPFSKSSLEGRLQRQLVLHSQGLEIPDPMRFFEEITRYRIIKGMLPLDALYEAPKLDALAAAFTAWVAATAPGEVTLLGHPDEGLMVLPVPELNPKY